MRHERGRRMGPIIKRKKTDPKADPQNIQRLELAEKDLESNYFIYIYIYMLFLIEKMVDKKMDEE